MKRIKTVTTELPPCAIAKVSKNLIVGTYDLNKESGKRTGSLDTYSAQLDRLSSISTESAVLDLRQHNNSLYSAHSTGEVRIWNQQLAEQKKIQLGEETDLVTQIALQDNELSSVLTNGELVVSDIRTGTEKYRSKNHDLEAWAVMYGEDPNLIFTGGDDRALTMTDLRIPYMLWNIKPHDAGVTSILPRGGMLWTGGYDDCLNFIDLRTRRTVKSTNLGGGVWRLIPHQDKVLVCCMYGGLSVLDGESNVLGSLENHGSMVYDGAWVEDGGVTCSFYDKMLQKWTL